MDTTRSGWIIVRHPETAEQHSRHVQEREAISSAARLSVALNRVVLVDYQQQVAVDARAYHTPPEPEPDPLPGVEDPEPEPEPDEVAWAYWGQTDVTFRDLPEVPFGEMP